MGSAGYSVEGFAPLSRATKQLRGAGISADTLQGFLARTRPGADDERHLDFLEGVLAQFDSADAGLSAELRKAVQYLAQGDTETCLAFLREQGRFREVPSQGRAGPRNGRRALTDAGAQGTPVTDARCCVFSRFMHSNL